MATAKYKVSCIQAKDSIETQLGTISSDRTPSVFYRTVRPVLLRPGANIGLVVR